MDWRKTFCPDCGTHERSDATVRQVPDSVVVGVVLVEV